MERFSNVLSRLSKNHPASRSIFAMETIKCVVICLAAATLCRHKHVLPPSAAFVALMTLVYDGEGTPPPPLSYYSIVRVTGGGRILYYSIVCMCGVVACSPALPVCAIPM